VVYELFLVVMLFQTKEDARRALAYFDPQLNQPLKERHYAANCDFTWEAIFPNIYDRFFIAHFIGWVLKSLMLRDQLVCWAISISWEIIEIGFLHMLPNFAECWWDQLILDVLVTNGLGIYVGHKLCNYLEIRRYKWSGIRDTPTTFGKLKRVLMQFTPHSWIRVRWEITSSLKRFFTLHLFIIVFQLEELNAFFLKFILWVPPESSLNVLRLATFTWLALPGCRQCYAYMTDPTCKRIGTHTALGSIVLATELLMIIKFGRGEFPNAMTYNTKVFLGVCGALYLLAAGFVLRYIMRHRSEVAASVTTVVKDRTPTQ